MCSYKWKLFFSHNFMGLVWISKESNHNHCQVCVWCNIYGFIFTVINWIFDLDIATHFKSYYFHYVNNIIAIYQFFMFLFFPGVKKDLLVNEIVSTFSCSDDKVHLRRRGKFPFPHSLVHLPALVQSKKSEPAPIPHFPKHVSHPV